MFLWTGHFEKHDSTIINRSVINLTRLTPLPNDRFKTVTALDKQLSGGVSFQYTKKSEWYLTIKDNVCFIEPKRRAMNYERASSFLPLLNLWFDGYTVFESSIKAGWYLRKCQANLSLQQYDGTSEFKMEASFKVTKNNIDVGNLIHRSLVWSPSCSSSLCDEQSDSVSVQCCKDCVCFIKNENALEEEEL